MIRLKKLCFSLSLLFTLTACHQLDDYMLGKDNTPSPKTLKPIASSTHMMENWSVPTGVSKSTYLKLKPTIVGNIVYTANASGVVSAINTTNGHLIWSKQLGTGIVSGPTIAQNHVIVGTDSSTIIALKQNDGQQLWQSTVSGDVLAKPIVVQDKVITKTIDGNLYAFDLTTGNKLWLSEHGSPSLILKASSSPVIVDNKIVLVGYSDGKMDGIDVQTGQTLWQRSIAYASGASDIERLVDIDADPIVSDNMILLASYQGYLGALSLSDGQFIWRKPASTYRNIVVHGNTLYMTDSNDVVWAVNKNNGQVNWKQEHLKARGLTEPTLIGNRLVIGDKTGMLHILSTQTGKFMARTQLESAINTAPCTDGSHLYVITANGKLSSFSVG